MSQNPRKYFSGNTLEQALLQAASHFGVRPNELAYKQLEKRHGFLRKRRGVIIEVDPETPVDMVGESPELPAAASSFQMAETASDEPEEVEVTDEEPKQAKDPENRPEARGEQGGFRPVEIDDELIAVAGEALEGMFEVSGLDLQYEVSAGDERLEIELEGQDEELLLEDRGSLLLAMQHLMPRLIRGLCGRAAPCRVDAADFHATHESELQDLARRVANEVKSGLEPRTLHPRNPSERRIVHIALAEDDDVDTESQGKGFFKRVTVRPVRRRPRGFDRYS
jgi:spoIIIJ-associated protein